MGACIKGQSNDDDVKMRSTMEDSFELLSPTFTQDDVKEWTNCALLIPHEPLRMGLETLVQLTMMEHYQDGNAERWKKQIDALYEWYTEILYFYVHHHHDAEEKIYFKWLQERTEVLPEKMSDDHKELIEMMDAIKNGKATFFDEAGKVKEDEFAQNMQSLHSACAKFRERMLEHLNEEEQTIPGLLRKHNVKPEEEGKVVDEIVQSLGFSGNKIMLPWIIDCMRRWGGQEMVKGFEEQVPSLIMWINNKWWVDHFNEYNKGIVQRVQAVGK